MRRILGVVLVATVIAVAAVGADPQDVPAEALAFEAATVKLAAADAVRNRVLQPSPIRLSIPGMTLSALVYAAYGNGGYNTAMSVRGGPDWARTTAFAVEGVAAAPASPAQMRLMLQKLLVDQFGLKTRDADEPSNDVLTLVVDRSDGTLGPKVRKWDGTCPADVPAMVLAAPRRPLLSVNDQFVVGPASDADDPALPYCPTGYRAGGIRADGVTMVTIAELLSLPPGRAALGAFTVDRTRLTDRYTMELDYYFPVAGPTSPGAQPQAATASLATAVREQWGLRLVPGKGSLRVVVIESARMPDVN